MAVHFPTVNDYLSRQNSIPDWGYSSVNGPNQLGSGWQLWFKLDTYPTGSQYVPIWLFGDPALIHPYIRMYVDATGVKMDVWDGTTLKSSVGKSIIPTNRWSFILSFWDNPTKTLKMYRANQSQIDTLSNVNLLTIPWVENMERLGGDATSNPNKIAGLHTALTYTSPTHSIGSGVATYNAAFDKQSFILEHSTIFTDWNYVGVGLESVSDLVDWTGTGRGWISNGNSNSTPGPFALVNNQFAENWNDGTGSNFTLIDNAFALNGVGTNGSCAFACSSSRITRSFEAPYPTSGTINFNFSVNWSKVQTNAEYQVFMARPEPIRDGASNLLGTRFTIDFYILWNGSVRAEILTGSAPSLVTILTPAGSIPLDGTPVGIQYTWSYVSNNITVDFYVNNVKKATATTPVIAFTFPYYNQFYIMGVIDNSSVNTIWTAIDDFQYSSAYNGLIPPPAPNNMPKLPVFLCNEVTPLVSGMSIDCTNKDLIITGSGFTSTTQFTVKGPNNADVPVTPVSVINGSARLHMTNFQGSGKYCVTAAKPSSNCGGAVNG